MQKIKFWQFWERPLFNISEYAFNTNVIQFCSLILMLLVLTFIHHEYDLLCL